MDRFEDNDTGRIFSWAEVSAVHKSRRGIYQKSGSLVSLLTDLGRINPCYPDFEGSEPDTIFYTGAGRRGDQKRDIYNRALIEAMHSHISVPLFCKIDVNRWKFMGYWTIGGAEYVFEEKRGRMIWRFILKRGRGNEL